MSLPANKMTFVFLKRTGQILATATRLALPPNAILTGSETTDQRAAISAAELKRLVGDELPVRDMPLVSLTAGASSFDVVASGIRFPANELDVVTGDFKPTSVADPRQYYIDKENLTKLGTEPDPTSFIVTVTGTKITIVFTSIPDDSSNVLVWVFRDDKTKDPILLDGVISKAVTVSTVEMPVALTPGNYHVLVLVQGFRPAIYAQSI